MKVRFAIAFFAGVVLTASLVVLFGAGGRVESSTGTAPDRYAYISENDGPLTLAEDHMVWNITKDDITVRSVVSPDDAWSVIGPNAPEKPDRTVRTSCRSGRWSIAGTSATSLRTWSKSSTRITA